MEKRAHPRTAVEINVAIVWTGGHAIGGQTRNISPCGVFIQLEDQILPSAGTEVDILFSMPANDATGAYRIQAVVAWQRGKGAALNFRNLDRDDANFLQNIMRRYPEVA